MKDPEKLERPRARKKKIIARLGSIRLGKSAAVAASFVGGFFACAAIVVFATVRLGHIPLEVHIDDWLSGYRYGRQYEWMVDLQARRLTRACGATIFLGDSITYAMATSEFPGKTENLGVGGDTIEKLTYRVRQLNLSCARLIVVAIGVNNWNHDHLSGFGQKYARLLSLFPKSVPVVAAAILPINEGQASVSMKVEGANRAIVSADRVIETACEAFPNCHFAAAPLALFDARGNLKRSRSTPDGLHPSAAAYGIWEASLRAAMRSIKN